MNRSNKNKIIVTQTKEKLTHAYLDISLQVENQSWSAFEGSESSVRHYMFPQVFVQHNYQKGQQSSHTHGLSSPGISCQFLLLSYEE